MAGADHPTSVTQRLGDPDPDVRNGRPVNAIEDMTRRTMRDDPCRRLPPRRGGPSSLSGGSIPRAIVTHRFRAALGATLLARAQCGPAGGGGRGARSLRFVTGGIRVAGTW